MKVTTISEIISFYFTCLKSYFHPRKASTQMSNETVNLMSLPEGTRFGLTAYSTMPSPLDGVYEMGEETPNDPTARQAKHVHTGVSYQIRQLQEEINRGALIYTPIY
jgi:hypothetical protein